MFIASYNYNRNLDSHMMKNTEWGVVAYLSHSKYGINSEININNNSNYITGYSAVDGTNQTVYPRTYGTDSSVTLPYIQLQVIRQVLLEILQEFMICQVAFKNM